MSNNGPYAKVIADSISPLGVRLTTMELRIHRYMLPEFNTHRMFSRNSASTRAIPIEKALQRVIDNPAFPLGYLAEQPGMQAGKQLEMYDYWDAEELVTDIHQTVTSLISKYLEDHPEKSSRLHKSIMGRYLEPFMWQTIIVSGTSDGWNNFHSQRCSTLAQDEIRIPAEMSYQALDDSTPEEIEWNEWHLPYITKEDREAYGVRQLVEISSARCARVSYLTHDGVRDCEKDLGLHEKLYSATPPHYSPFEHPATPSFDERTTANFTGWTQYRHIAESEISTGIKVHFAQPDTYYGQEW